MTCSSSCTPLSDHKGPVERELRRTLDEATAELVSLAEATCHDAALHGGGCREHGQGLIYR